jgi:penicillin-binding protein 1C
MTGAILSDPQARRLEFGRGGNMEFPVQTAVKTGTSTDFRDAWAFAYNYKFLAAVWMGNLDNAPTRELTGSAVPMLLARSLMNEALRGHQTQSLAAAPAMTGPDRINVGESQFRIRRPTGYSRMAVDPRVPAHAQAFTFEAEGFAPGARVEWRVDGTHLGDSQDGKWLWPLTRGRHEVEARSGDQHSHRVFFVR